MWSRNQRQDAARLLLRRATLLSLLFLVLLAASGAWDAYGKERESRKLRLQAEAEREDLLRRQGQIGLEIEKLKTDRGLEEALREQFSMAERGEKLIVIVDAPVPESIGATSTIVERMWKFLWPW